MAYRSLGFYCAFEESQRIPCSLARSYSVRKQFSTSELWTARIFLWSGHYRVSFFSRIRLSR